MATQEEILADMAAANEKMNAILVSNANIRADIAHLNDLIQNGASLDTIKTASAALLVSATAAAADSAAVDEQTA